MTAFLAFAGEHPLLTGFFGYLALEAFCKAANRLVRAVVIAARGWPPSHLDADGDWRPVPKDD